MAGRPGRLVYSTGTGRVGPGPAPDEQDQAPPAVVVARLRVETKGRGGKTVTIVDGLPRNAAFLAELARELKRACATGGAIRDGAIELQGDRRETLRRVLADRGCRVRG